jgi:hypothetical protein
LLCHWLQELLPSKYSIVGPTELKGTAGHSATTGDTSAGTGTGERLLSVPVKVDPSRGQSSLVVVALTPRIRDPAAADQPQARPRYANTDMTLLFRIPDSRL